MIVAIRDRPDWMTRSDYYILRALDNTEILEVQSPTVIAYNLDLSREYVSKRLGILSEHKLTEKLDQGRYRITTKGSKFISGELDKDSVE